MRARWTGLALTLAVAAAREPYDTNPCYWTWVEDGYGGDEQLHC